MRIKLKRPNHKYPSCHPVGRHLKVSCDHQGLYSLGEDRVPVFENWPVIVTCISRTTKQKTIKPKHNKVLKNFGKKKNKIPSHVFQITSMQHIIMSPFEYTSRSLNRICDLDIAEHTDVVSHFKGNVCTTQWSVLFDRCNVSLNWICNGNLDLDISGVLIYSLLRARVR